MSFTLIGSSSVGTTSGSARTPVARPSLVHAPCRPSTSSGISRPALDYATSCPLFRGRARNIVSRLEATAGGATAPREAKPTPVVKIDNLSDAFATVVRVQYGDRATELLETITALKNLNLNIRRAKLTAQGNININTFYITEADTSEKIVKSARLEEIRMTVLNSLIATFPESASAMAGAKPTDSDMSQPLGRRRNVVPTRIQVDEAPNGAASLLTITTLDRPGLLVDIVRVLKDINLNVVSAEVDTEGNEAKDEFFVTYHGEPLTTPMVTLVTNALQYYLSLNEVAKEESY